MQLKKGPEARAPDFKEALGSNRLQEVRRIPKSDLHNHSMLGSKRSTLEKMLGIRFSRFAPKEGSIRELNGWLAANYRPLFDRPEAFEKAVEGTFLQARSDGVVLLEMSMDLMFGKMFRVPVEKIIAVFQRLHGEIAPGIEFRPEIGMARTLPVRTILAGLEPYLDSGFFRSVDLYDDESAQPIENFRELYRFFKRSGLKLKAHAGEFGTAESVREAVEVLDLDAVQHGIAAAGSPGVMKWLAERGVRLNICPASNIRLKRTASYKTHPIRVLYDHGVKVTVNSDDVLLFGAGVSEQFLGLYRSGAFSAEELEEIRMTGLTS
ncbi:MAG TPA: hypothetical protein VMC08_00065 [Bacteroidales bacterium]|nr:hypothetical protein [Bacteroidales bacterium]